MKSNIILNEQEVIKDYEKEKNIRKVSKNFNVPMAHIKKILIINGYEITNRRYSVDFSYFDIIDTEEKSYWLGFLFADGYIRERKNGNSLELKLGIKDKSHLELFKKAIKSEHKIVEGHNKVKYKGGISISHLCSLSIYSNKLVESMKLQGIHSRKTYTIEKPSVPKNLMRHFIRGFFDGDGCLSFNEDTKRGIVSIVCVSVDFRNFIKDFMINECKVNNIYEDNKRGYIQLQSKFDIVVFLSYIFKKSNIHLNRKKQIYDNYKKYAQQGS